MSSHAMHTCSHIHRVPSTLKKLVSVHSCMSVKLGHKNCTLMLLACGFHEMCCWHARVVCMHEYIHACIHVHVCCMHACMYSCMHVHTRIHAHVSVPSSNKTRPMIPTWPPSCCVHPQTTYSMMWNGRSVCIAQMHGMGHVMGRACDAPPCQHRVCMSTLVMLIHVYRTPPLLR